MATEIKMPQLSDTMDKGTILRWFKKEGDQISRGDALAEVATDKADLEVESFFKLQPVPNLVEDWSLLQILILNVDKQLIQDVSDEPQVAVDYTRVYTASDLNSNSIRL